MLSQQLPNRYIEKRKLVELLRRLFGNNYGIEDHADSYVISVPRKLTELNLITSRKRLNLLCNNEHIEILSLGRNSEEHAYDAAMSKLSEMEKLKEVFTRKGRRNADSEYFVPHDVLSNTMTQELVKEILLEINLEHYRVNELSQVIVPGAQRTFAILVLIGRPESILAFVEDDQMLPASLDQKLPLQLNKLLLFLDDESAAAQFYGKQWAFVAPVFSASSLPRALEKKTVLPFIDSKPAGEGGFGDVHEIQIEPSHHSFAHSGRHRFVRKELRPRSTTKADYELELRNLSTLKLLKHPCIIDLLACFTYRDKYNFIFPLADGGSLADLLSGQRPSPFEKTEYLLIALCGLSSAIRAVHEFLLDDFEAIGCHHDLKPSNILLDHGKFLLADFGLSRFKEVANGSASYFRGGRGYYLAPECEDLGDDFKKHLVHRSSDIWSFGCILCEILTFLLRGVEGVRTFKSLRMFNIDGIKYYRFHRGRETPNKFVWDWLAELGHDESRPVRFLIQLIEMLLELKPEKRPKIAFVDTWLRYIIIDFLAKQIESLFEELSHENDSILALIERQKFKSWRWVLDALATETQPMEDSFLSGKHYASFEAVLLTLQGLRETLQATTPESHSPQRRIFLPLRKINDTLYNALPGKSCASARTHFECQLLESQNSIRLQELSTMMSQQPSPDNRIGHLAAIKRLKMLVETSAEISDSTARVDHHVIDRTGWLQDFWVGRLRRKDDHRTMQTVLVETKNYDEHYSIEKIAQELFARLEATVHLLNTASSLRVLHCRGFYHDLETYSLGLVYDYPDVRSPGQQQQVLDSGTLYDILKQDLKGQYRPLLGSRFRLAHILASSLFEFHKVHWVQKGISAFNIIFFRSPAASWKDNMDEPYFMGFLSSRQDDEAAFTEGPTDDTRHRDYLHPEYLRDRQRFLQHFDYYSLGLVLLELGLWRTLDDINKGEAFQGSPEKLRDALLRIAVPRLGQTMGAVYQSAVEVCLRWDLQVSEQIGDTCSPAVCLQFRELVVQALASCRA